jgi:hypothetical protein
MVEAEFPPPEMHQHQECRQRPAEMHRVERRAARMLHDARDAREQPRHAKADHHAHDDADMREDFRG